MKVFQTIIDNRDCDNNYFYFINDDSVLNIYQGLNCDLMFTIYSYLGIKDKVSFVVRQDEYPEIFDLITNLLDRIESMKYLRIGNIISPEYRELFAKGYFSWQSDAPANEEDWGNSDKPFVYNYFNILPLENAYELLFVNNSNNYLFSVEVNTDRSRYGQLRFEVFDFFKKLDGTCEKLENEKQVRDYVRTRINNNKVD